MTALRPFHHQPRCARSRFRRLALLAALATVGCVLSVRMFSGPNLPLRQTAAAAPAAPAAALAKGAAGTDGEADLESYGNSFTNPSAGFRRRPRGYCTARGTDNASLPSIPPEPVPADDKVAVVVDGSNSTTLIPVIRQFLGVLPDWKFVVFHSEANAEFLRRNFLLARWVAEGRLRLQQVPDQFSLESEHDVSKVMMAPWLWRQLSEEHVLVFGKDSVLCASSPRDIDHYLHYDFIGAPEVENGRLVYDGGLSLRRRSSMLAALERHRAGTAGAAGDDGSPPGLGTPDADEEDEDARRSEGSWFSAVLARMPKSCLPSPETAAEFSVTKEWFEGSMGARALWRWHPPAIVRRFRERSVEFNLINEETRA